MVSLWDFLTLLCLTVSIGGALASAKIAHLGFRGDAIAVVTGTACGLCCAWTMRVIGNAVVTNLRRRPNWPHSASPREQYFIRALYLGAILWIVLVGFLAEWLSLALLRVAAQSRIV
jgi:hypothetical protein